MPYWAWCIYPLNIYLIPPRVSKSRSASLVRLDFSQPSIPFCSENLDTDFFPFPSGPQGLFCSLSLDILKVIDSHITEEKIPSWQGVCYLCSLLGNGNLLHVAIISCHLRWFHRSVSQWSIWKYQGDNRGGSSSQLTLGYLHKFSEISVILWRVFLNQLWAIILLTIQSN